MKILIATDAWYPQVNGVVHTLDNVRRSLERSGQQISILSPQDFNVTFPLPGYKEIRLIANPLSVGPKIWKRKPDAIHIATEGPIGLATRMYCVRNKIPFTTSYHTKFPEFIHARVPWIKEEWVYKYMRWFHKPSKTVLVTTPSMMKELRAKEFRNDFRVWTRGADLELFHPSNYHMPDIAFYTPNLILTYVGRLSVEKNIDAFLDLKTQFPNAFFNVVGDGPDRKRLQEKYKFASFPGVLKGEELAKIYARTSVFVFPSKTDTFGIVMIEANASGAPVAAYPVTGPIDYIVPGINGSMSEDLSHAVVDCLKISRSKCRRHVVKEYSWERCAEIFYDTVKKFDRDLLRK